jgi:hypothetical protein
VDAVDNTLSALGRDDPNNEMAQTFINGFKTLFSLFRNKIENGGRVIQSSDREMKQVDINILGNNGEMQTDSDLELGRTAINIMKAIFSAYRRNTNNEFVQAVFDVADTMFLIVQKIMSNDQPTSKLDDEITKKLLSHFNSAISAWVKGVELNRKSNSPDRTGEAKIPQWGTILGSLATSVLNKFLDG